ncbi:hypothetical protein ACULNC_15750 [Shigella flexneri]
MNRIIHTQLGKGEITEINTGHAGQLLRLLSADALCVSCVLISETLLAEGFYSDSIRSTAWIKDGVMHTDEHAGGWPGGGYRHERVGKSGTPRPEYGSGSSHQRFLRRWAWLRLLVNPIVGAAAFAAE